MAEAVDAKTHWDRVYATRAPASRSWHRPHLETSLRLIQCSAAGNRSLSIIDVGGGDSTLVDDLLLEGFENIAVLDVSAAAIAAAQRRLGSAAGRVHWIVADVTEIDLGPKAYDLWHDRAVFHFLASPERRAAYVRQVLRAVKPGGHVIVSTFGPEGPTTCSGLPVKRYDAESLHREFGAHFRLLESFEEQHHTPSGSAQQFLYCRYRVE
jgi:2-polyprenyl-3-methyl-5-hydroxy-6-metoxy-1,4-benzoquinol methylase